MAEPLQRVHLVHMINTARRLWTKPNGLSHRWLSGAENLLSLEFMSVN